MPLKEKFEAKWFSLTGKKNSEKEMHFEKQIRKTKGITKSVERAGKQKDVRYQE